MLALVLALALRITVEPDVDRIRLRLRASGIASPWSPPTDLDPTRFPAHAIGGPRPRVAYDLPVPVGALYSAAACRRDLCSAYTPEPVVLCTDEVTGDCPTTLFTTEP